MKLCFWDFDGTLYHSALPENGKLEWFKITGQPWPYQGWWGRLESLDPRLGHQINTKILNEFKLRKQEPNTINILLTNRLPKFRSLIESILDQNNIVLDKMTFKCHLSKSQRIWKQLELYPECTEIEVWDDMEDQLKDLDTIKTILSEKGIKYIIHPC